MPCRRKAGEGSVGPDSLVRLRSLVLSDFRNLSSPPLMSTLSTFLLPPLLRRQT